MATQKAFNFDITANGTTVIVASGGAIVNAIEIVFNTSLAAATGVQITITDSAAVQLFTRVLRSQGVSSSAEAFSLSGLNIPTTSSGGLSIVTNAMSAGTELLGSIIYTVP